jgi:hypothetical protein
MARTIMLALTIGLKRRWQGINDAGGASQYSEATPF